ncbi:MAG TPA: VCBS repeat-containing protein [Kofleriaceae bacterium]|jgi:hypothetical protein|nr:VCBS repeat-containing protein [Kofleriaceae bacterium]
MARRAVFVGFVGLVLGWYAAWSPARADDGYLARLAGAVRARLDEAAAAHAHTLVPPVPVVPRWKPQKLGSLDLGAPVVAVAAADLDGDNKAELYLVTSREVIAVGVAGKLRELGRIAFTGDPASPASRDVVGTAVVEGRTLFAGVSAWATELRVEWRGKTVFGKPGPGGFRVCGERLQLATGRNHFREGPAALFGARCRGDLTDPAGYPLRVRGELSAAGVLEVAVEKCAVEGAGCQPAGTFQYKDVGVAFEIADVNRDGTPDLVASSASAPGDADAIRVIPLGSPAAKPVFRKPFNGGVAGIAVADIDGDGVPEVIAVVRLAGSPRVDLWRLD